MSESQDRVGQQLLEKIKNEFANYRAAMNQSGERKGYHYPDELKQLVSFAVAQRISKSKIKMASGLSKATVANWQNLENPIKESAKEPEIIRPKRLKLASTKVKTDFSDFSNQERAVIRLHSGISIEIPVAALSENLISSLNRGLVQ